jgi:hypothetical protein
MSKLNPQKASAYVGPGVLRKGGKITPVPNGPLIKKTGQFKGSTLKAGGVIKKAQGGEYITQEEQTWNGKKIPAYTATKKVKTNNGPRYYQGNSPDLDVSRRIASSKERTNPSDSIPKAKLSKRALEVMNQKNGGKVKKAKAGAMIKRADGSMSKRGLWDNMRANKGSGKKPTKQMLVQEKKIKAKSKK